MFRNRLALWVAVVAVMASLGASVSLGDEGSKVADAAAAPVEPVMGGYCHASYLLDRKAVPGDPKFQSVFRGEVYYHASAERKQAFDADPVKYLPQLGGLCAAALGGPYGTRLAPDPRVFALEGGRLFMFSSTRAMRVYLKDPPYYIERAQTRFDVPEFGGHCPVNYVRRGTPAAGDVKFRAVYQTKVYLFTDQAALDLFNQDPRKYLPQYDGYCPMSMSQTRLVVGDPTVFSVVDGKLYFFADELTQSRFTQGNSDIIKKADVAWALAQKKPE